MEIAITCTWLHRPQTVLLPLHFENIASQARFLHFRFVSIITTCVTLKLCILLTKALFVITTARSFHHRALVKLQPCCIISELYLGLSPSTKLSLTKGHHWSTTGLPGSSAGSSELNTTTTIRQDH